MAKKATVVYVIDDDESVRRVLARFLRSAEEMSQGAIVALGFHFRENIFQKGGIR